MLELLEDEHARALAEDEAVAIAVEGAAGPRRLVVAGGERGQEDESGHAEGVDHAVGAAREDHVGAVAADHLEGLADGLRAGGAGGQAVGVDPLGAEDVGQVRGGRARLLLGLADRMQLVEPEAGELGRDRPCPSCVRLVDQPDEPGEILLALAGPEVDAEPGPVQLGAGARAGRIVHGHLGGGQGELACSGNARPTGRRRRGSRRAGNP